MDNKRTCHICGKKYSYCPSCPKDSGRESWHTLFCTDQCKEIDSVLNKHFYKKMTTAMAAKKLLAVGADKMNIANPFIKEAIDEIIESAAKKAVKEKARSVADDKIEIPSMNEN